MADAAHIEEEAPIFVSILGYREEDEWVALALEMDLRGFGETFQEALEELIGSVEAQISFALFKKEPRLIWHPAEKKYFDLFERVRREYFAKHFMGKDFEEEYRVGVRYPDPHAIAQKAASYHRQT